MSEIIDELLEAWKERHDRGQPVSAEELCRDHPKLLPELKNRIDTLLSRKQQLGKSEDSPGGSTGAYTRESTPDLTIDYVAKEPSSDWPKQAGRYHIYEEIAHGGMGAILRAHDPNIERTLAVKVMLDKYRDDSAAKQRFLEEARITGQLQHPGIAPVHELGTLEDGRPFFAMKLIEGRTLAELLKERESTRAEEEKRKEEQQRGLPRFVGIFEQICQTLAYAHSQGILHRDLKPHNVMVGAFGEVQVMDWGLAKIVGAGERGKAAERETTEATDGDRWESAPASPSRPQTEAGVAMGTPAYMAPEQARGEITELDRRADVFGLGAILCEILTGKPPFWSANRSEVFDMARRDDLDEALTRLDRCRADVELIALCKKCLALHKAGRPRDAGAVAEAIAAYQASVQEKLRQAELDKAQAQVKAFEEKKRRRWIVAAAAAVLLLVVGAAVGALWYQQVQADLEAEKQADDFRRQRENDRLEADRKARKDRREQEIAGIIGRVRAIRDGLHKKLKEKGGVFELLNKPALWKERIYNAKRTLQTARELHARAESKLDHKLLQQIDRLAGLLRQDESNRQLALKLENVRVRRFTIVEVKLADLKVSLKEYAKVFEAIHKPVNEDSLNVLAAWIRQSPVREQLLAALDDWATVAFFQTDGKSYQPLLRLARSADPDTVRNQIRDARLWRSRAQIEKLVEKFRRDEQALRQLTPQTLFLLALLQRNCGLDSECWLRKAVTLHPSDYWLCFRLANTLCKKKKMDAGVGFYHAVLAVRPKDATTWNNLGNALAAQKKVGEAVDAYRQALKINPQFADAWYNRGVVLAAHKKLDKAIHAYRQALQINPQFADAWNNLGVALAAQKKFAEALDAHRQALQINARSGTAWYNIGLILSDQKKLDEAVDAYRKALQFNPRLAQAWNDLGLARFKQKMLGKAIDAYRQALKINPEFAEAWSNLGNIFAEQKKLDDATNAYRQALKFKPHLAEAWSNLGVTLAEQKKLDEAVKSYQKAIKISPRHTDAWYGLGLALAELRKLDEAETAFHKAIAINKTYANAHGALGDVLLQQGKFAEAIFSLQRWQKLVSPGHPVQTYVQRRIVLCQHLLTLQKKLPDVLAGRRSVLLADRLALADLCRQYLRRYRDAAHLYAVVLAKQPQLAEAHRYNAACAAALAAANGSDAVNIDPKERAKLRRQALDWLVADLQVRQLQLQNSAPSAVLIQKHLQHSQNDADLTSVRDKKELAKLPEAERNKWQKLWDDVAALQKKARASYRETILKGSLTNAKREQLHEVKLIAGKTYVIDMHSKQFDTFLKLQDTDGKLLAKNDDINYKQKILNSRILFTPKLDGAYRIVATSYEQRGRGSYKIIIREFADKNRPEPNRY